MTLLDRQRPAIAEPTTKAEPMRSEDELRRLLDSIAPLWLDGLTLTEVAEILGLRRGAVAGLISRARARNGDIRFAERPRPPRQTRQQRSEADRERYWRKRGGLPPAPFRSASVDEASVGHSLSAAAVLEAREPETPDVGPQLGLPLWELSDDMCRFPTNSTPVGKAIDLRFCGRTPIVRGQFCAVCAELAYLAPAKRGAQTGGKFALRAVAVRPR
jgi:hypothetical protein